MLFDAVSVQSTRKTRDGYLVADVRVARSGIQEYLGSEVDADGSLGLRDRGVVRVYRPPEEVFSADSLRTYAHRPVTDDHPGESVSADNWKRLAVGQTGGDVVRDGDWVRVPMVIMDGAMISQVESGKRELSMGYTLVLDATPGKTPDGQDYDAVQRELRMNHLAVVAAARAGAEARIGDGGNSKEDDMSDALKTVVLGDRAVNVKADDVATVEMFKVDAAKKLADMQTSHDAAIAAKDAEIAKRDAELTELRGKVLDGAALDAAVAQRSDLISVARAIVPALDAAGKSNADIRRAVVVAKLGDAGVAGKSEAYIDAYFDILAKDARDTSDATTQLRQFISNQQPVLGDAQAYEQAVVRATSNLNAHRKN